MNPNYHPGNIVSVESLAMGSACYMVFSPPTRLFHHLVIRARLEEEDDYEIIEMRGNPLPGMVDGCNIGRLSWYAKQHYVVYEVNDPEAVTLGKKAAKYCSRFGRTNYDYGLYFWLPLEVIRCWANQLIKERRLRRIKPHELHYFNRVRMVCTRLPNQIWQLVGKRVLPPGLAEIPASYIIAWKSGWLNKVDEHFPEKG